MRHNFHPWGRRKTLGTFELDLGFRYIAMKEQEELWRREHSTQKENDERGWRKLEKGENREQVV